MKTGRGKIVAPVGLFLIPLGLLSQRVLASVGVPYQLEGVFTVRVIGGVLSALARARILFLLLDVFNIAIQIVREFVGIGLVRHTEQRNVSLSR